MVKDPKSRSFLHGFAEQWLTLRKLDLASPDPKLFPNFTPALREAMIRESLLFFEALVREDRSILDLLDADFTFVNEELAKHYGIAGVKGKEFVRVKLPAEPRRHPDAREHPDADVERDADLAGEARQVRPGADAEHAPAAPAAGTRHPGAGGPEATEGDAAAADGAAPGEPRLRVVPPADGPDRLRVRELRRGRGVAREGRRRPIDASGVLPDGRKFDGPAGLRKILRADKDVFVRCVAEKMLTYALGRGLEHYDRPRGEQDRGRDGQGERPVLRPADRDRQERPVPETDHSGRSEMKTPLISRRTVLRGLGTAVALPLLDAMLPAGLGAAGARRSRRAAWRSSTSPTGRTCPTGCRRRRGRTSS